MEENKLVPKRRFKGYKNYWKKSVLEEISTVLTGGTPNTNIKEYWFPKEVPWMSSGEINKDRLNSTDDKISFKGLENSSARWIEKNSVLIALAGQGKTRGKVAINNIRLTTNQSIAAIVPGSKIYYEFLYQNLTKRYEELRLESSGDGTRGGLNKRIIQDVNLLFPLMEEQQKIGEFFKVLDERIANQERKIAKVKALKESYLNEMFPQEGETVPKRRFKGFEGEWIKKKLDDVAFYRRGSFPQPYGEHKWYNGVGAMPFVQVVDVDKNLRLVNETRQKISRLAQPHSVYVEKGKILVTLQGSIGRVAITQYPSYVDRTLLIFEDYKIEMDNNYFAYIIEQLFEIEKQKAPGGTIKTITKEALSEFIIRVPDYKEQQKIGSFFKNLDDQIRVEEARLEKLKKMKEAYLEEMFV